MHCRFPAPNGMYAYGFIVCLFSSENLSGSNFKGFGQNRGSLWRLKTGNKTPCPFRRVKFVPGIV